MSEPIGGIGRQVPTRTVTSSTTATTDDYIIKADTSGGAVTVTLFTSPGDGASHVIEVVKTTSDASAVTVTDGTFTFSLTAQYDMVRCEMDGNGVWIGTGSFDVSGTGDVEGPSSSTNGDLVTFSGSTGKIVADSGIVATTLSSTASIAVVNASTADSKAVSAAKGSPLGQRLVSATSVVTPTSGATVWFVEAIGCGGGGGGVSAAANSAAAGGGGGAGSYSSKWITTLAASYSIGIGAAGTAGSAGVSGGTGGSVLVSTVMSVTGGIGGLGDSAVVPPGGIAGGAGGAAGGGGDINFPGVVGGVGLRFSGTSAMGGFGAATRFGGNGAGGANDAVGAAATANTGSGGGGAACNAATGRAGGAGATGAVLITEYR